MKKFHLTVIIIFLSILSCSDEQIKENEPGKSLALEFRDEGFISQNIYKIIIVKPKYKNSTDSRDTEKYAKKRALISLRKYVQSRKGKVSRNINAALLNLIDQNGKLRKESSQKNRDIYFFEIEKINLKEYINKL